MGVFDFPEDLGIFAKPARKPALSLLSSRRRCRDLSLKHRSLLSRDRWERILVARGWWTRHFTVPRGVEVHCQGRSLVGLGLAKGDAIVVHLLGRRGSMNRAVITASRVGLVACGVGVSTGGRRRHCLIRAILVRQRIDVLLSAVVSEVWFGSHPWLSRRASPIAARACTRSIVAAIGAAIMLVVVVAVPRRDWWWSSVVAVLSSKRGRTATVVAILRKSWLIC